MVRFTRYRDGFDIAEYIAAEGLWTLARESRRTGLSRA